MYDEVVQFFRHLARGGKEERLRSDADTGRNEKGQAQREAGDQYPLESQLDLRGYQLKVEETTRDTGTRELTGM